MGVSPAAVYRHYPHKEALLDAVCAAGFEIFASYLVRSLTADTPLGRLRAAGHQYLAFATDHPKAHRALFLGAGEGFTRSGTGPVDAPTFRFLVDRVTECQAARVLAKGDPLELSAMIWAHVHGLASLRTTGHFARFETDAGFAAFYEKAVDRFLAGLCAER